MTLNQLNDDSPQNQKQGQDVVLLVNELLEKAVKSGASDVHFEPSDDEMAVKFRLDGVLNKVERLPKYLSDNVIARLKVLGGLLTYRNDIPQEGRIEINKKRGGVIDQRLAVFPTINGQRAVVRLFHQHKELTELGHLGFSKEVYTKLKKIAVRSQGVLLMTGPAGSGKSTTLAALLRYILKSFPGKSIVTLEDPVEIRVEGVTQVQITPYGQMSFPTALRSLLRQDPQVLMIGEIRDSETAGIVVEAGLTGHFLMSTMHSGSPAGAILRLLEMGIEPYQVTSSISAVVNQRLVRRLCDKCKRKDKTGEFKPSGCQECFDTGFRGRVLISEMVELSSEVRRAILGKTDLEGLEKLLEGGGHKGIAEDGKRLVTDGITTQDELEKACGIFVGD